MKSINETRNPLQMRVSKIGNVYGIRLSMLLIAKLNLKKGDSFYGYVSDLGTLEISPNKHDDQSGDVIDLKIGVQGTGLSITLTSGKLAILGWFPKQELIIQTINTISGGWVVTPTFKREQGFFKPNLARMTESDLKFSYKLTQDRIEYLTNKVKEGKHQDDIFVLSRGVKLLDLFHMEWSKMYDYRLSNFSELVKEISGSTE